MAAKMTNDDLASVFKTGSYVGTEKAQYRVGGDKPPRTAKFVASVDWSRSPAPSPFSYYLLSTDRRRTGWFLWEQDTDDMTGSLALLARQHVFVRRIRARRPEAVPARRREYRNRSSRDPASILA